jgi:protein ImuB
MVIAREFSPRIERHRDDLVTIDVGGLDRLIGPPQTIGEELRRTAAVHGQCVHVAVTRTRAAALLLALGRPGLTVADAGHEREMLDPLPIRVLEKAAGLGLTAHGSWNTARGAQPDALRLAPLCERWGIRTLGEFAALPRAELASRLGPHALAWQRLARGDDAAPLVPTGPQERFESSLELDWPIEGLEPLSFVLTRLLEPLSARLEQRDRGAAALHLALRLTTKDVHERHLQLPSPIRDARTLRTLLLLDLDSHPPSAAIDCVTILIDPTPGRIVQHTLFTRTLPTPEQLSMLVARLNALMGQDRVGSPATVDSHRPGAFAMTPFAIEREHDQRRDRRAPPNSRSSIPSPCLVSSLRRCRQPVPARVAIEHGRPVRLVTDRRGFAGGSVAMSAGPWRTSGHWWAGPEWRGGAWDRDEWDVTITDGAVYRIFRNRETDAWFVDAIVD